MRQAREHTQVWPAPIALGVLSTIGLIAALLSDQAGDWIAWLTLAMPVAISLWYGLRRGKARASLRTQAMADSE